MQAALVEQRRAGIIHDQILLLEHPHVITVGGSSHEEHVLADETTRRRLGIQLVDTGRGGDVTYHGPGQLIGYPILDLKPNRRDTYRYLRDLEETLIKALREFDLEGRREDGLTGVWVGGQKIAAIGVRVSSRWITSHGFALNVATDLSYFDTIVPCGLHDREVTSISECLGRRVEVAEAIAPVLLAVGEVFDREIHVV
ncbi:MAG: lipoyl(octanoyl) transferase LipB [Gemmatimonadota bacterium]|nr:MAG: lipoyl(octanoyl) transferase LipB [Gemmatimonadota bacterium]